MKVFGHFFAAELNTLNTTLTTNTTEILVVLEFEKEDEPPYFMKAKVCVSIRSCFLSMSITKCI